MAYTLVDNNARLELHAPPELKFKPLYIDFSAGKTNHRRINPGKELLAKAVGYKKSAPPSIIDATAGLGRDAFVLASLGCQVTLLERNPLLHALLADAITRAQADFALAPIMANMTLLLADAQTQLATLEADVIYLDPMYPHRNKSALVKKEMQILQAINGADTDAGELLTLACKTKAKRVVVKRPKGAEHLNSALPDAQILGKNTRFDLYLRNG
jgi:16S rRNA (guanine1516-N2)-methyltransferase